MEHPLLAIVFAVMLLRGQSMFADTTLPPQQVMI